MGSGRRRTGDTVRAAQLPLVAVLAVVGGGLAVVALRDWELGSVVVALGLVLAGVLRLALPAQVAGWLVVRGRVLDAAMLLGAGLAVLVLALNVPGG